MDDVNFSRTSAVTRKERHTYSMMLNRTHEYLSIHVNRIVLYSYNSPNASIESARRTLYFQFESIIEFWKRCPT